MPSSNGKFLDSGLKYLPQDYFHYILFYLVITTFLCISWLSFKALLQNLAILVNLTALLLSLN